MQIGQSEARQRAFRLGDPRRQPLHAGRQPPQHGDQPNGASQKAHHEQLFVRQQHDQRQHGDRCAGNNRQCGVVRADALIGQAAQQARRRHGGPFRQRPQGESQCDGEAIIGRLGERTPLQPGGRWHRQAGSRQPGDCTRRRRADGQPDQHRAARNQRQLPQVNGAHRGTVGPQNFQCGDGAGARTEIGGNAAGHANAGHHQRSEANQAEKLAQLVDEIAGAGRAVAAITHAATLAGHRFQPFASGIERHAGLQLHPQFAGVQAAQRDQFGAFQILHVHHQAGAKAKAIAGTVRLFQQCAGISECGLAQLQPITGFKAQFVGQRRLCGGHAGTNLAAAFQHHPAIERPRAIDGLHFGQHGVAAVATADHATQFHHVAHRAQSGGRRPLFRRGVPARNAQRRIAAHQKLAAFGQPGVDGTGEAADASKCGDAEHQAHGQNAQAGQAAAQFPQGEAKREAQRVSASRPVIAAQLRLSASALYIAVPSALACSLVKL